MVNSRKLELQRQAAVKKESERSGIHEGLYKITEGKTTRWYTVWVEFYPKVHWMIEEVRDLMSPEMKLPGTRRKLDDATKGKLRTWL